MRGEYSVSFEVSITGSEDAQILLWIGSPVYGASKIVLAEIIEAWIEADDTTSQVILGALYRTTGSPSGGTELTPAPMEGNDQASVLGAAGTIIQQPESGLTLAALLDQHGTPSQGGYQFDEPPSRGAFVTPSTTSGQGGIAIVGNIPTSGSFIVGMRFIERG
jgi:hypothetical protein